MHVDSPARQHEFGAPVGSRELAEGLMLMRASTLKVIRLQLAMERNDRRAALELVDDLVALDRSLHECLAPEPVAPQQVPFRNGLDADRAMLDREKLALAAEVILRPHAPAAEPAASADDDWLGPSDFSMQPDLPPRRRRWWLAAIPVLATAAAGGAYLVGFPEMQASLEGALSAIQ